MQEIKGKMILRTRKADAVRPQHIRAPITIFVQKVEGKEYIYFVCPACGVNFGVPIQGLKAFLKANEKSQIGVV